MINGFSAEKTWGRVGWGEGGVGLADLGQKDIGLLATSFVIKSNLSLRTPLYYGQSPMSQQNSHIFFRKKVYNTDPLKYGQRTLNLGPREQIHKVTSLLRTLR